MKRFTCVFSILLLLAASWPVSANTICLPPWQPDLVFKENGSEVWAIIDHKPIKVGQQFSLTLRSCLDGQSVRRVDAIMPSHGHGMNYNPKLTETEPNLYRAEGMLFHMPGRWEFIVEVENSGANRRLTRTIEVSP